MRVAFPTEDGRRISEHFGRSKYFLIYDTETKEKKLVGNPHGEGPNVVGHAKLLNLLLREEVSKVICWNIGVRMREDLKKVGIKVEFTDELDISRCLRGKT
ncbi:MAG: NifB/NifX family molybdenum-iron cluster-binding protein [Nanoarchaeota archaeon]|nr:NifB/NifX family molybdenum-iron cluster-binding protein [Nanoarchaeota archaeon]